MESKLNVDVSKLSETERQLIFNVLKRDEDLRKRDEQRINRLKAELNWLRRRGAIKGGLNPLTSCDRCRCELGRIINRGAPCTICLAKTCKSCRIYPHEGTQWICVVCHKQLELEAATGEWMNEFVRRASRKRDRKGFVPSSDIVKELILRSQLESDHDRHKEGPKRSPLHSVSTQARSAGSMESSSPRPRRNTIDSGQQPPLDFHQGVYPRGDFIDASSVDSDEAEVGSGGVHSCDVPIPISRHRSPLTKQRTIQVDVESPVAVERLPTQVRGNTAATRRRAPQPPPVLVAAQLSDRSDSGISQDVQSSPKSSPSWRSNSNGSTSGRLEGRVTTNVPSEKLEDTTASVDFVSDISDCEVEPSTGVVFRKVTLRRKKRKEVERAKRSETDGEQEEEEEEDEDEEEEEDVDVDPPIMLPDNDGRRLPDGVEEESVWKAVRVRPWWGVAGSSFSLPRFSHSRSQAAVASSHVPWEPSVEMPPGGGGPLTRTNSCDSLWWDATATKTTLVLDGVTDVSGNSVTGVACDRNAKRVWREYRPSLNGWLLPLADAGQASVAPSSRSTRGERYCRRSIGDEGSSGSWDDLRVSSPEFEEDDALDTNYSGVSSVLVVQPSVGVGLKHADSFTDLLSHVNDKIVPEGDEYRIVFISSSSSKSSGLNSVDGSSSGSSSRRVSMLMEDDSEWDDGGGGGGGVMVPDENDTSPPPPPLPLVPPPLSLQDPASGFENEDLYDYFRDFANAEWKEKSVAVLEESEHEDDDRQPDKDEISSFGNVRCLKLRRVNSFDSTNGERGVGEQTFYNSVVPVSGHMDTCVSGPEVSCTVVRDVDGCDPEVSEVEVVANVEEEHGGQSDTSDDDDTEFYSLAYVDEGIDSSDDECVFGVYEVNHLVDDQNDPDEGLDDGDLVIDFSEPEGGIFGFVNPHGSVDPHSNGADGNDTNRLPDESEVVVVSESSTPVIMVHVAGPETALATEEVAISDESGDKVSPSGADINTNGDNEIMTSEGVATSEELINDENDHSVNLFDTQATENQQPKEDGNATLSSYPESEGDGLSEVNNEPSLSTTDEGAILNGTIVPSLSLSQRPELQTNDISTALVFPHEEYEGDHSAVSEDGEDDAQGETSSDGEKLGSDTDSLDTVIEGESFRRMRQLAIRQKLLQANKDWDADSVPETSNFIPVEVEPPLAVDETVVSEEKPPDVVTHASLQRSSLEVSNESKEGNESTIQENLNPLDTLTTPSPTNLKPTDLHQLVAQSRALTASFKNTDRISILGEPHPGESPAESSVLEKYFMTSLEHMAPPGFLREETHRRPLWLEDALNRSNSSGNSNPSIDDVQIEVYSTSSLSDDGDLGDSWSETQSDTYCELDRPIVSADEGDSETTFDDDDCSSTTSSSSDEGSACLRPVATTRPCVAAVDDAWYRLDMSLHTIIEESCEESESERERHQENKKKKTKAGGQEAEASKLERYFNFGFVGGSSETASSSTNSSPATTPTSTTPVDAEVLPKPPVQAQSNISVAAKSPNAEDGDFSDDAYSETESSVFSECSNRDENLDDEELAQLAASRLEKYFLTGFLGLEVNQMDKDNEEDVTTPTSEQPPTTFPPKVQETPLKGKNSSEDTPPASSKEDTEDEETIAFNKNDGCNTIKRKKKLEDEAIANGEPDDLELFETTYQKVVDEQDTGNSQVHESSNISSDLGMEDVKIDKVAENLSGTITIESGKEPLETPGSSSPPSGLQLDNRDNSQLSSENECLSSLKTSKVDNVDEILTVPDSVIENLETLRSGLGKPSLLDDQQNPLLVKNNHSLSEPIVNIEHENSKILTWDASYSEVSNPCLVGGMSWGLTMDWKQQSRDSGFIGSSDDLLQEGETVTDPETGSAVDSTKQMIEDYKLRPSENGAAVEDDDKNSKETLEKSGKETVPNSTVVPVVPSTSAPFGLFRSSSTRSNFGAASTTSDDEAQYIVNQLVTQIAKTMSKSPQLSRAKPPEIEVFESELTKLMQTIPGIDATVKEIVEELSSTDYCSDSYESSDYASSDHEGSLLPPRDGSFRMTWSNLRLHRADSGRSVASSTASRSSSVADDVQRLPEETMYIYQRFMDSLTKMTEHVSEEAKVMEQIGGGVAPGQTGPATKGSPPTAVKMLHHICNKLTSLMREVQADRSPRLGVDGDAGGSNRRIIVWNKPGSGAGSAAGDELSLSSTSSTAFDSEDSPTDTEPSVDSDEVVPGGMCGESATAARDNAVALSEARALVRALATGSGDIPRDEEEDDGSGADGLERWSSDMTIVDDDVRFISIHRSEPVLSMPESPVIQKRNSADLSSTKILATSPSHSTLASRPHSVQGGHQRGGAGSTSSLYHRTFKSEWEVWNTPSSGGSASSLVSHSAGSGVGSGHKPYKHKSCDPLPSDSGRKETKSTVAPSTKDKKKHGGLAFMLRQKSGSVASLRESQGNGSNSGIEVRPIKLQVQSRSSLHLQPGKAKEEVLATAPQQHGPSQQRASSLHRLFGVGNRHRDSPTHSSHFKKGLSGYSTSNSSPSNSSSLVKSCRSNPEGLSQVGVDVTTAAGVDLSDHESGEGRKTQRPSSAHYPLFSGGDSDNSPSRDDAVVVGSPVTTIYVPSGAYSRASAKDAVAAVDPSAKAKAFTLPRAGLGGASVPLHENVSFLHKSSRGTDALSSYSLSPMTTNTLPHSYTLVVPQNDRTPTFLKDKQQRHNVPPRFSSGVSKTVITQTSNSSPGFQREAKSWPEEADSSGYGRGKSSTDSPSSMDWNGRRGKSQSPQPTVSKYGLQSPSVTVSECPERSTVRGGSASSHAGSSDPEEDIDRLVALHRDRSLSQLGVCSESMSSVYSAAGGGHYGNVTVRGEVQFSLAYNYVSGALEVHVKQCRDLAPVDTKRNRSDPYVKVYLLPDKSKSGKRKTRVKKHTLNPLFNEVLKFPVTISELETRTLWLTVWHSDMFGRNEFLGEVTLPMGYEAWEDTSAKWYMLQERLGLPEEVYSYKGDLVLSLKFVPPDVTTQKKGRRSKGSLHVLVKEARNLMATAANGTSDPFCKCYLLPEKGKGNKQKTHVAKKTCNPKWNHTFLYEDVSLDELKDRCLELTLWDYDRLTSNDFLGGVRLSLGIGKHQGKKVDWIDSRGEEVTIWQAMIEKPNLWVDGTILLRPTMDPRQTTSW